jgi:hypothetical protein
LSVLEPFQSSRIERRDTPFRLRWNFGTIVQCGCSLANIQKEQGNNGWRYNGVLSIFCVTLSALSVREALRDTSLPRDVSQSSPNARKWCPPRNFQTLLDETPRSLES